MEDCSGLGLGPISNWESLKYGIEFCPTSGDPQTELALYICFNPDEEPSTLASRCVRLTSFLPKTCPLAASKAKYFALLITEELLSSEPAILDILGGFLFRRASNVYVLPPLRNLHETFREFSRSIANLQVPSSTLVVNIFGGSDSASEYLRQVLRLSLLRDILRTLIADKRPLPEWLLETVESQGLPTDIQWAVDSLTSRIDELKPRRDLANIWSEWEEHVQQLYNRSPPPVLRKRSLPGSGTRKSLRKRSQNKQVDGEPDQDQNMEEEVKLVVDNWLQCDNCSKWRIVDSNILSQFEDKYFSCSDVNKSCSDPGDDQK